VTLVVNKATPTLSIICTPNPVAYQQQLTWRNHFLHHQRQRMDIRGTQWQRDLCSLQNRGGVIGKLCN
jgi:hypothetical protein